MRKRSNDSRAEAQAAAGGDRLSDNAANLQSFRLPGTGGRSWCRTQGTGAGAWGRAEGSGCVPHPAEPSWAKEDLENEIVSVIPDIRYVFDMITFLGKNVFTFGEFVFTRDSQICSFLSNALHASLSGSIDRRVTLGYLTLGVLVAVLAQKIARRS